MANSFKQMAKDGTIKRPDGRMTMSLDDIHVQEGFNKRVENEHTLAEDEKLFQHLMKGKPVPPLEVRVRDEGGVWVVEGHRRRRAYSRCRDAGKPVERIQIIPFTGNDVERIARIMNSNTQLPLSPYEQSLVVKELAGFNLSPDEIAALVGKSRATIDKLLAFSQANHDVQTLVREGSVAVDAAVDRVKEHGEAAGKVLAVDVEKAKKAGKKKVTKSFITPLFSATRARRLCELLYDASPMLRPEGDVLLLLPETREEINKILNEYRQQHPQTFDAEQQDGK
ncbi:chromosome partitioning protein ParB [Serratia liquefaciens]|uniref:chromosome partitioning protein ParB n=1 Tax=Serratia liquefaciens TaxID=614 RepID=UPI000D520D72|nr:chromosome partitioning protein ParB [Serratia liquefaciens]PVD44563.1 chromosome partitioning protein ParB [Serratia liquefaciens]QHT50806.1 chromosome partitioning protein ParB [Serratia liquefaciens]